MEAVTGVLSEISVRALLAEEHSSWKYGVYPESMCCWDDLMKPIIGVFQLFLVPKAINEINRQLNLRNELGKKMMMMMAM